MGSVHHDWTPEPGVIPDVVWEVALLALIAYAGWNLIARPLIEWIKRGTDR